MAVLELAIEVQPFERRRSQVELFGWNERVYVLVQAVIEKTIARWIGDPVVERLRAGTSAVEPGESQTDGRAIGKRPGIERVQAVSRPPIIVLKQLGITEGGLLGGPEINSEAISVEGIVSTLVEQCFRTFMDAAERRSREAVAVIARPKRYPVYRQHDKIEVVKILPVVIAVG